MSYEGEDLTFTGSMVLLGVAAFLASGVVVGAGLTAMALAADRAISAALARRRTFSLVHADRS